MSNSSPLFHCNVATERLREVRKLLELPTLEALERCVNELRAAAVALGQGENLCQSPGGGAATVQLKLKVQEVRAELTRVRLLLEQALRYREFCAQLVDSGENWAAYGPGEGRRNPPGLRLVVHG